MMQFGSCNHMPRCRDCKCDHTASMSPSEQSAVIGEPPQLCASSSKSVMPTSIKSVPIHGVSPTFCTHLDGYRRIMACAFCLELGDSLSPGPLSASFPSVSNTSL